MNDTHPNFFFEQKLPIGMMLTSKTLIPNALRLNQVHGQQCYDLHYHPPSSPPGTYLEGDGWFWKWQNLKENSNQLPCIITADCLPILILGKEGGLFVHAGWRGVQKKIYLHNCLKEIDPYFVYIGPSIQRAQFEVTAEFKANFPDSAHFHFKNERITFDLQQEVKDNLLKNFPKITIQDSGICTFSDHRFHSFRREKIATRNYHYFTL